MPIKPENLARYPDDWKEIVELIRERSGNRCEGSPAYPDCRARNRKPHPVTGSIVVLTVGHLDHTPENCSPENLRAWCQRCHLTYDAPHHAMTAARTRKARLADGDLFDDFDPPVKRGPEAGSADPRPEQPPGRYMSRSTTE